MVGDKVDVMIITNDNDVKIEGWVQATVARVNGDDLKLELEELPMIYDRIEDRYSNSLAKFQSKTKEIYDWKN